MIAACIACRFFAAGTNRITGADGTCHRHAPTQLTEAPPDPEHETHEYDGETYETLTLVSASVYTGWPDVREHDWCGEFAP